MKLILNLRTQANQQNIVVNLFRGNIAFYFVRERKEEKINGLYNTMRSPPTEMVGFTSMKIFWEYIFDRFP